MDGRRFKPLYWTGNSYRDYTGFPDRVQDEMGFALYRAQVGGHHPISKLLKGFTGSGVVELAMTHDGNAYRTVYTVRFAEAVYVLHAFQKKSKRGIATPKSEIDLVRRRFRAAEEDYQERYGATDEKTKRR